MPDPSPSSSRWLTAAAAPVVRRYERARVNKVRGDQRYTLGMARRVFYRIDDRPDGQFDAVVTIEPTNVIRRDGFASMAEAEEWVEGLRFIMSALGAPVAREDQIYTAADTKPVAPVNSKP